MSDLIDRQQAIDAVRELYIQPPKITNDMVYDMAIDQAHDALKNLPSAQPERKKGRWKMEPDPYGFFGDIPVCSECGHTTEMRKTYNFCPNCGADMRGEEDGN